jgi:hypothetical protein
MNTFIFISCGVFNLGFVIFHLLFWKIFRWKADLRSLTPANRGIMQVLNLCLTYIFLCFGAIVLYYRNSLLTTELGKAVLASISLFWFLRVAEQIIFFDMKNRVSQIILIVFFIGSVLHVLPLLTSQ